MCQFVGHHRLAFNDAHIGIAAASSPHPAHSKLALQEFETLHRAHACAHAHNLSHARCCGEGGREGGAHTPVGATWSSSSCTCACVLESAVTAREVGAQVCLPMMRAVVAWRSDNSAACVHELLAIRSRIYQIGGSNMQRELWRLLLIRAAIDAAAANRAYASTTARELNEPPAPPHDSSQDIRAGDGVGKGDAGWRCV